ncbi:MAG: polysaccharide deacetylase family protein [Gemmatimonadota bacterium]|nr:polysaccharide deacetylase family protein [Gemmatimonadota bacterium]
MRDEGFTGIFWEDLYGYMDRRTTLAPDSILLTFDDGYLDNWVYAFPILKKYGMKGTVFVNPDFVDPGTEVRPTLEDVWAGRCRMEELDGVGFLNWAELRAMEASGLIDVQSHALTHTWYFSGPRIVDFHTPQRLTPYPWLAWNARPERKPFYMKEDQQHFVPWGYPVFEHGKSLVVRRFIPDGECVARITDYVAEQGGTSFFRDASWQETIRTRLSDWGLADTFPGYYETDEQRLERIRQELSLSKSIIETNLDKRVDYLCWPGGGNDETTRRLAIEVGYKAWTLGSKDRVPKRNLPGEDPVSIKRMPTTNVVMWRGHEIGQGGARHQMLCIAAHQKSFFSWILLGLYKLAVITGKTGR